MVSTVIHIVYTYPDNILWSLEVKGLGIDNETDTRQGVYHVTIEDIVILRGKEQQSQRHSNTERKRTTVYC